MLHLLKQSIICPEVFLFDIFWPLAAQPSTTIVRVSFTVVRLLFKDIVQPKKRGVKRGTIRFVLTSYTIADAFFDNLKG